MRQPPCDNVTHGRQPWLRRILFTLNPPLTAASKNDDWQQTMARCTANLRPSHDIVRSEYLSDSRRLCKSG